MDCNKMFCLLLLLVLTHVCWSTASDIWLPLCGLMELCVWTGWPADELSLLRSIRLSESEWKINFLQKWMSHRLLTFICDLRNWRERAHVHERTQDLSLYITSLSVVCLWLCENCASKICLKTFFPGIKNVFWSISIWLQREVLATAKVKGGNDAMVSRQQK